LRASGSSGARFYVAGRVAEGTGDRESHVWGRRMSGQTFVVKRSLDEWVLGWDETLAGLWAWAEDAVEVRATAVED
jgi:hypothetical protein